jgi:hypothetical protein
MKYLAFTSLLLLSAQSCAHDTKIIDAVKKDPAVMSFIKNVVTSTDNKVTFHEMPLDSICGFVGCEKRTLVNIMITSTIVNAPTKSLLARVTVMELNEKMKPQVVIVTLN